MRGNDLSTLSLYLSALGGAYRILFVKVSFLLQRHCDIVLYHNRLTTKPSRALTIIVREKSDKQYSIDPLSCSGRRVLSLSIQSTDYEKAAEGFGSRTRSGSGFQNPLVLFNSTCSSEGQTFTGFASHSSHPQDMNLTSRRFAWGWPAFRASEPQDPTVPRRQCPTFARGRCLGRHKLVFKCSPTIALKIIQDMDDFTEYTTLQYLEKFIPNILAPRSLGLVRFGTCFLLFMSLVPDTTLEAA